MAGELPILVSAAHPQQVEDLQALLERAGHHVAWHPVHDEVPEDPTRFRAIVVAANGEHHAEVDQCRKLRNRLHDNPVPILFVGRDGNQSPRLTALEAGADAYLSRPFAPREFLAQMQALLRLKQAHDRLVDRSSEVALINKRLHQVNQQINQELALARRIQLSFLPQQMPNVPGLRFAVHYDLCGQVGGDFYDVFRLDEEHVGFYVADAMGHGIPASLLTIFVKKGARTKEIFGKTYRLVPPNEVLEHLNRDLIQQQLAESPFITMVYGLLNFRTGVLKFARAGHPHPICIPGNRNAEIAALQVHGSLMGVFDTTFALATVQLQRGDKVLVYSDGIENAVWNGRSPGAESLMACATQLRQLAVAELVERLPQDLFGSAGPGDDLTLLGVEFV
jgi:sigma-B regulation protein RsbU (phosphoserine phosphatase)